MPAINRPPQFSNMGAGFVSAFGNVDCVFTVDGVDQSASVRGILRQKRELEIAGEFGDQDVEAVTHVLSVAAVGLEALEAQRDSVTIAGTTYDIKNQMDDGRAMLKLYLTGDI
ncbi:head-tail joining protein [Martelella sp. AMO21009]